MFLYETHLHTSPVSRCASASVADTVACYKNLGYAGIFITNHFIDGNISVDRSLSYEERIRFYFSDYEEGVAVGKKLGIDVFPGVEMTYGGTDFLVYGPDMDWYLAHPETESMQKSKLLPMLREAGALVIQAHPFREAGYIDHIRLFPRCVDGVEIHNANRTPFENEMAEHYADSYGLLHFAGSDNHSADRQKHLAGMMGEETITSVGDFIEKVKNGQMNPFVSDDGKVEMIGG